MQESCTGLSQVDFYIARGLLPFMLILIYILNDLNYTGLGADAQQMCKKYNSTLPIVDGPDRQRSVVTALSYFKLNGIADVWLGATAFDYGSGNWWWLDGSKYSGSGKLNK